ncbi:hypothetical protein E2C01_046430 [Portunus trituberculatus]|uniref:Uncharacterized protein n=1 Tax=Portunus trituberculatus TaxID=210409 RepID=A0A5B7FXW0_PORTR|nr:hypothetical protein [Portunus trituberculatus]
MINTGDACTLTRPRLARLTCRSHLQPPGIEAGQAGYKRGRSKIMRGRGYGCVAAVVSACLSVYVPVRVAAVWCKHNKASVSSLFRHQQDLTAAVTP